MNNLSKDLITKYYSSKNENLATKKLYFDVYNKMYYDLSFKTLNLIIKHYTISWLLKSLLKNKLNFIQGKYFKKVTIPKTGNYIIISNTKNVLVFDLNKEIVTKLIFSKDNFEKRLAAFLYVEKTVDKVKSSLPDNHFPTIYEIESDKKNEIIAEISTLSPSINHISINEWPQALEVLSNDLYFYYKHSDIKFENIEEHWINLKDRITYLDDINLMTNLLNTFDEIIKEKKYLMFKCLVHSDFSRFNVVKGLKGYTLIDFSGAVRKNLFYDLYIQERWKPTSEFWLNIDNEKDIPIETSFNWLKSFVEKNESDLNYKFENSEIKFYFFLSLLEQLERNNKMFSTLKHPIIKILKLKKINNDKNILI